MEREREREREREGERERKIGIRERERDFMELAHAIMETGKSKIFRVGWQI